jgi:predicted  nucleic acid-binding Zn-ribbon protein
VTQPAAYLLVTIISVIVAAAAFYLSTRAARTTATAGIHAVDAEAYTRASAIYEDTINNLRADITGLRTELAAARAEIRDLRDSNDTMSGELAKLRQAINGGKGNL